MAVSINGSGSISGISGIASAWVNFNGTGTPAIRASGNVSSITDQGTGKYRVNFTSAFSDINYVCVAACGKVDQYDDHNANASTGNASENTLQTTSYTYVRTGYSTSGMADSNIVSVACFR